MGEKGLKCVRERVKSITLATVGLHTVYKKNKVSKSN